METSLADAFALEGLSRVREFHRESPAFAPREPAAEGALSFSTSNLSALLSTGSSSQAYAVSTTSADVNAGADVSTHREPTFRHVVRTGRPGTALRAPSLTPSGCPRNDFFRYIDQQASSQPEGPKRHSRMFATTLSDSPVTWGAPQAFSHQVWSDTRRSRNAVNWPRSDSDEGLPWTPIPTSAAGLAPPGFSPMVPYFIGDDRLRLGSFCHASNYTPVNSRYDASLPSERSTSGCLESLRGHGELPQLTPTSSRCSNHEPHSVALTWGNPVQSPLLRVHCGYADLSSLAWMRAEL